MADNVTVDNGSLTDYVASTDEVTGPPARHIQRVKLCYSAAGDETHIGADVNGIDVDVTRSVLPTGATTLAEQQVQTTALQLLDDIVPRNAPQTYGASSTFTPAVTVSRDFWNIHGSASKTVYVTKITITGTATATSAAHINLVKRSTATTGGTSTTQTNVPYDSNNAAAGASVKSYTAVATEGTLVGQLATQRMILPIPTLTATQFPSPDPLVFDFTGLGKQPIVLRGAGQQIALQPGTALPAGTSLNITVEWYEL